ncbi:MAG: DUF1189 domain-containing protein [Deltaproteobacteria bacterium]|nr:DUF1189 domain-containing protein [Deltaproteobacteria bacterium]
MGFLRSLMRVHWALVVLVFFACAIAGAWVITHVTGHRVERILERVVSKYDSVVPEITIQGGQASINKDQPYFVNKDPGKGPLVIIDTRRETRKDAFELLKEYEEVALLTRTNFIFKSPDQTRVVSLSNVPDMVINSASLRAFKNRYFTLLVKVAAAALVVYFLFAKLLQALIMGLVPYLAAQAKGVTFSQAFKIAILALIPPVTLDVIAILTGVPFGASLVAYFLIYGGLIAVATVALRKSEPQSAQFSGPINP